MSQSNVSGGYSPTRHPQIQKRGSTAYTRKWRNMSAKSERKKIRKEMVATYYRSNPPEGYDAISKRVNKSEPSYCPEHHTTRKHAKSNQRRSQRFPESSQQDDRFQRSRADCRERSQMKRFLKYTDDEPKQIDEAILRNASAVFLFNRILNASKNAQKSNDAAEMMKLIASQNTHLAAMMFAMTQFVKEKR